jgi:ABC-type multidrug transport system fused ATPase/permease subunit
MLKLIIRLKSHLSFNRKKQLFFLFLLMVSLSFAELFSLASIVPFISIFLNPELYYSHPRLSPFIDFFKIQNKDGLFLFITIVFVSLVLISGSIKLLFLYLSNQITNFTEADFKAKIFEYNVNQSYSYHLKQGSNVIMSSIIQKTSQISLYLNDFVSIISGVMTTSLIFFFLVFLKPFIIISVTFFLITFFTIIFFVNKDKILKNSKRISQNQNEIVNIFQDSIGYVNETIIYSLHNIFISKFNKAVNIIASNMLYMHNKSQSPRIYLEYTALLCFAAIIFFFYKGNNEVSDSLTILAALGLGTQKLLPLINRIQASLTRMKTFQAGVEDTLDILDNSKIEKKKNLPLEKVFLKKKIKLNNVYFSYNKENNWILDNINLEIKKGSKVGIKGTTGSGKSTLGNIIIGLLDPTKGQLFIDDILINSQNKSSWYKSISIIPQNIFLNDVSIAENIAIGIDPKEIDLEKVKNAAKQAQIHDFIESTPNQYNEKVGERGIKLSGGQRQRIGIARALYREAKVILFDEATNQLDTNTESLIVQSINNLDKEITIILIAHRLSTLKDCDQIIDLSKI